MEPIKVSIKNTRQKSVGSLKTMMPMITVPTAPMPVQTAYAVPTGKVCTALYNKNMLMDKQIKKPANHQVAVLPVVSLAFPRQAAKPASKIPAIIRRIQFIFQFFSKVIHYYFQELHLFKNEELKIVLQLFIFFSECQKIKIRKLRKLV